MSPAKKATDKELISVETDVLKERLNKVYEFRRGHSLMSHKGGKLATSANGKEGLFEYLWDLKEKALLEHRSSVDVPGNWLSELEADQSAVRH